MSFVELTNETLLQRTEHMVREEKRFSMEVLRHLREVENRRLHAERGFSSMWEFCTRRLGYSEGAAHRRIAAMRLIRAVPHVEQKLESGQLTLSVAAKAQDFISREKVDPIPILERIEGKSFREVERIFAQVAPAAKPRDRMREIRVDLTELRISLAAEVVKKLEELRDKERGKDFSALISELVVAAWEKSQERCRPAATTMSKVNFTGRQVPQSVRKMVWVRDGGKCTYRDPLTGVACGSNRFVEVDHIKPRALGGSHHPENLRLLCREHNLLMAAKAFGPEKVDAYRKL